MKIYSKYSVFIIDEVGYLLIDIEGDNLLFQLINKRYETHLIIITTNITFSKWGKCLEIKMIDNAILNRLVYHSYIFNITGNSDRLKDKIRNTKNEEKYKIKM